VTGHRRAAVLLLRQQAVGVPKLPVRTAAGAAEAEATAAAAAVAAWRWDSCTGRQCAPSPSAAAMAERQERDAGRAGRGGAHGLLPAGPLVEAGRWVGSNRI
jgi:hypothetical protein